MEINHEYFMRKALILAQKAYDEGEVPVGAVVVHDGEIIGAGYNQRTQKQNAMLHAETMAIYNACEKMGSWRLWDCDLYVTLEPCPMCTGAIMNARITTVYYGADNIRAGSCGTVLNLFDYPFTYKVNVVKGILQEECGILMVDFFRSLRKKNKQKKAEEKTLTDTSV
ncbi:MAG: tRNA adenosine(34) deaminase TadA [Clostridia bacterium]|nr:tRNA adenosine(34) deaminase TadA [Clostridia bacterium]